MGSNTVALLGLAADPESPSAQACQRLVEFFKPYQAKELARLFACSPKTAEAWKQGQWPGSRHQHAIVAHFGRAWLDFVFAPLLPGEDRALAAQLAEIEGRLAAVRASIEDIEGKGAGHGAVAGTAAPAGAVAAQAGAARGAVANGRGREARAAGAGLAGLGARAGAVALAVMMIAGSLPDQVQVPRLQRGGPARVVRVLRGPEVL